MATLSVFLLFAPGLRSLSMTPSSPCAGSIHISTSNPEPSPRPGHLYLAALLAAGTFMDKRELASSITLPPAPPPMHPT